MTFNKYKKNKKIGYLKGHGPCKWNVGHRRCAFFSTKGLKWVYVGKRYILSPFVGRCYARRARVGRCFGGRAFYGLAYSRAVKKNNKLRNSCKKKLMSKQTYNERLVSLIGMEGKFFKLSKKDINSFRKLAGNHKQNKKISYRRGFLRREGSFIRHYKPKENALVFVLAVSQNWSNIQMLQSVNKVFKNSGSMYRRGSCRDSTLTLYFSAKDVLAKKVIPIRQKMNLQGVKEIEKNAFIELFIKASNAPKSHNRRLYEEYVRAKTKNMARCHLENLNGFSAVSRGWPDMDNDFVAGLFDGDGYIGGTLPKRRASELKTCFIFGQRQSNRLLVYRLKDYLSKGYGNPIGKLH